MDVRIESNTQLTPEQERIYRLRSALERDGGTPGGFLELLAAVVSDDTWQRVPSGVNTDEPFTSFKEFIEAKPPFGLGHSAADVFTLLKIHHPHEAVADFRARMESTRAEVTRLLALDGVTDYTEARRARDIKAWASMDQSGGWWLGFFVACQVQPDDAGRQADTALGVPRKVSAQKFADLAGTSASRVLRYYRAWEAAFAAGAISMGAQDLYPAHDPIDLPPAEEWGLYYSSRKGAASERGVLISAAAEAEGIRPTKALEVAENPTALRAAILADARTADAARAALMDRLHDDAELRAAVARTVAERSELKKAIAVESRRAEQADYVRRVASEGSARTPSGLTIELPATLRSRATEQLALLEEPTGDPDVITSAYESIQLLVSDAIAGNAEIRVQEQRSRIRKTLSATVKHIESIDLDGFDTVADDDLRATVASLRSQLSELTAMLDAYAAPRAEG